MDDERHYMDEDIDDMNEVVFIDGIDHMNMVLTLRMNFTFINRQNHVHYIRFYNFDAQP